MLISEKSTTAAKIMRDTVANAREKIRKAEADFELKSKSIERAAEGTMDLFASSTIDKVSKIATDSRNACDELYATYQALIELVDLTCRPLVSDAPGKIAIQEVYNVISYLVKESAIRNDFNASINEERLGSLVKVQYFATTESKIIEKYWENLNDSTSYTPEDRKQLAEEKRIKEEKIAEEKRIAAEEKAKEERKRKEAEKRRELAEEKKKNEAEIAKAHMDNIVSECNAKVDEFKKELDLALKNYVNELKSRLASKLDELNKQKSDNDQYLSGLGFFNFAEKKEAKNKDIQLLSEINRISSPFWIENEKNKAKKVFDKTFKDYSATVKKYLESRFPDLVPKPSKPSFPDTEKGDKSRILYTLTKFESKTLTEIMEECGFDSSQKTSALLRELHYDNMVARCEVKGVCYFYLVDKDYVLKKLKLAPQDPTYKEVEDFANKEYPQPPEIESIKLPEIDI